MEEQNIQPQTDAEEQEIDLIELAGKLWAKRKFIFKFSVIGCIVGIIVAIGMVRSYTVTVTLAPESLKRGSSRSLANIASMMGLGNMGNNGDGDALNITLFPEMAASTPFLLDLLDTHVKTLDEEVDTTLTCYLEKHQKQSFVGTIFSLPSRAISAVVALFKSEDNNAEEREDIYNHFQLTKKQGAQIGGLRRAITADVDKKTGVTTINVTMQDPMVTAIVANTVVAKLQEYVTKYRVSKAQQDCEYWEQLYKESQEEYYTIQQKYAEYMDANKNVVLQSVLVERERLQNETSLAMQIYSQTATQLQMARAKVQEAKPVFAVVEPASVPLKPSGRSRAMTVIAFCFIAFCGASAWVLYGNTILKIFKKEEV